MKPELDAFRPSLNALREAAAIVAELVPPTPQIRWPLLEERAGCELWIKHENHGPVGAFKLRGGLVYMAELERRDPRTRGVIAATRGNHGQSIALAAGRRGLSAVIVVPFGNSREKNAAMRALGAELIEHGRDFHEAYQHAEALAAERGLHMVPSFHDALVRGVASYSLELMEAVPNLDAMVVPIGLGSGICGALAARAALDRRLDIIGVVAAAAPAYARSWEAGAPVSVETGDSIADGMAVRSPDSRALALIREGCARLVVVSEAEIRAAMRALFTDTHNLAEGAGAAALAAVLKEKDRLSGKRVAAVLSGGNVDAAVYAPILAPK